MNNRALLTLRFVALFAASFLFGAHLGTAAVAIPRMSAKKVLLVIEEKGKSRKVDDLLAAHLKELGLIVTEVDAAEPDSRAEGQDLVIISSSVGSADMKDKYVNVSVPVITWESYILAAFHMVGKEKYVDFAVDAAHDDQSITLMKQGHPLQAGLPNGVLKTYFKPQNRMEWAKAGSNATVIATITDEPGKPCLFAYEKGAVMQDGFKAPNKRIFLFLYDDTFDKLLPPGVALVDAAISWALMP